jgi:hypothetical protein
MIRVVSCFLALLLLSLAAYSQPPSAVLKAANKALGGEKVLKGIRSASYAGRITRASDGASGAYEFRTSPQALVSERYDLSGFEVAYGYNGKSGWIRDSRDGLRTLTGDAAKNFQAEAVYRNGRWLNAKANKLRITAGPSAMVNGAQADAVILTNTKGVQLKLYFDAASGRLVREEIPDADGLKTIDYSDYRTVQNVLTPFSIDISKASEVYRVRLEKAVYNEPNDLALFDYPRVSSEPLPDIPALLKEVRENADRLDTILENYSYTALNIEREPDKSGRLVEKSSEKREFTFYKGRRISRVIERNGKALSASEQADEERKAADAVADVDKREARRAKGGGPEAEEDNRRISLSDALKGSLLVNPRRERFRSRDVIVFDYEPNPNFTPKTRTERLFALCSGAVWVDVASKQVVRLEANLTKSAGNFLAKAKQGASFTLDNELVNDEIWLPSQADVNISVKILFAGININNLIRYGDYRRFRTEVKDAQVGEPPKP